MDESHASELDEAFLTSLRSAAEELVNPWPKGQSLGELSPTRVRSVEKAAAKLVKLASQPSAAASPSRRKAKPARTHEHDLELVTPAVEEAVGVTLAALTHIFVLDALKGFGPQKFKALHDHGVEPEAAVRTPQLLPVSGATGEQLKRALGAVTPEERTLARERAARQLAVAHEHSAVILTYGHPSYPATVLASNNPIPVLYVRGTSAAVTSPTTVACVGSRGIRAPYDQLQAAFAGLATKEGFVVVSGFALGADSVAHRAAIESGGSTVCVMPCGLDRPFPPENRELFEQFLECGRAAFVSEFPFGTGASGMTLRKRNKLIVAAAKGVLIGQSSADGGAMNAFRFAIEQRKPVATFESDGTAETSGNAVIAREQKVPAVSFKQSVVETEWRTWLSTLS